MGKHSRLAQRSRFMVILNGITLGFSKVSNVSANMDFETVVEGGLNNRVHYLPKSRQSPDKLTMEYGVASGDLTRSTFNVGDTIYGIIIMVLPQNGMVPTATYTAETGIVTKWDIDVLDAQSSGVMIKRIEIAHSGLTEVVNRVGVDVSLGADGVSVGASVGVDTPFGEVEASVGGDSV